MKTLAGLLLLLAIAAPAIAQDAPVAVLMTPEGEVRVVRGDQTLPGTFGMHLDFGDEVRTGTESRAEVLYSTGRIFRLGARGTLTLDETGSQAVADEFAVVDRLLTLRESRGTSAIGTVRGKSSAEILALSPRASARIRSDRPTFRWTGGADASEFEFSLEHDGQVLWNASVHGATSVVYPEEAPALEPGEAYAWRVNSVDPLAISQAQSQTAFFETLSSAQSAEVDASLAHLADLDVSEPTRAMMMAGLLVDAGLVDEAIARLDAAISSEGGSSGLQQVRDQLLGSYRP